MSHACCIRVELSGLVPPAASLWACQLFDSLCALFTITAQAQATTDLQQLSNVPSCRHALAGGNLVSWRLSNLPKLGQQLQPEAQAYKHCKQLQYQVMPGVLAAGPAMAGTAYLLATCLLPVVGFSDCSSAKYQALHAVKALHGMQVPHGNIRESNILCTSEAEYTCKVIVIDLGHSSFCTHQSQPCSKSCCRLSSCLHSSLQAPLEVPWVQSCLTDM